MRCEYLTFQCIIGIHLTVLSWLRQFEMAFDSLLQTHSYSSTSRGSIFCMLAKPSNCSTARVRPKLRVILATATILCGCAAPRPLPTKPEPLDPWVLKAVNVKPDAAPWLSNGTYGYRIDLTNGLADIFSSTGYNPQGEEKLESRSASLEQIPESMVRYEPASLDLRTGVLRQSWTTGDRTTDVQFVVARDGKLIAQLHTGSGEPTYTWIGGPKRIDPTYGARAAFSTAEAVNKAAWSTDIEIDGPVEDQQAIRSFMFYLRMAMHPKGTMSVGPYALSNTTYNGHIFWDADVWVFPAMAFIDPERAKIIPNYRLARLDAARQNAKDWFEKHPKSNSWQTVWPSDHRFMPYASIKDPPLMFAWESSVSGREVAPPDFRYEHHITGSVVWSLDQARVLGLAQPKAVAAAGRGAAKFWLDRIEVNRKEPPTSLNNWGEFEVRGVLSPDEFHKGNNDLYTNLLANWTLDRFNPLNRLKLGPSMIGRELRSKGGGGGPSLYLPEDKVSLLTYDDDQVRGYKQAAAVLAIYPLQYPPAEKQALTMLDRFADKVTPNGPAMSDSIHAIIRARFGDADAAYNTWHDSWKPFTDHAFMLFSEKRNKASTYFVTGAAGSLQAVIYGFLGFRIDCQKEPGAVWTKQLKGGYWLSIKPNLPPAWKKVTFKNFHVLGKRYTLTATHNSVSVTQGEP
jgi:hypothetical protein